MNLALPDLGEWVAAQTNRPLRTAREVDEAVAFTTLLGLPIHRDRWKCWDNLIGVWHAHETTARSDVILDGGAVAGDSTFLPSLRTLGHFGLSGINTDASCPGLVDGIWYEPGDVTGTCFGDDSHDFVASLSVIEHGVDVVKFLRESARILRPGGHLFVSFDFWEDPIDCGGKEAFGAPVRIFDRYDVMSMVCHAAACGLKVTGKVETECQDRVVNWLGLDYTFHNLLFRRADG